MVKAETLRENGSVSLKDIFRRTPELMPQKDLDRLYLETLIKKRLEWEATGKIPLDHDLKELMDRDQTIVERLSRQRKIIYSQIPIPNIAGGKQVNQRSLVVQGEVTIGEVLQMIIEVED